MKKPIYAILGLSVLLTANCQNKEKIADKKMQEQEEMSMQHIREYERILETNPKDMEVLTDLGNVYYDMGKWDKAVENYIKVLAIDSTNIDVRTDMGTAYKRMGLLDLAEREYKKGIEINPKHSKVHYNLGVIYYEEGRHKEALAEWESNYNLEQDPQLKEIVRGNIDQLKHTIGEPDPLNSK